MIATSPPSTLARYKLPAGLILSPRELKQYRRWQRSHTTLKATDQGYLPTATEYEEFQSWLRKQDSGYFSDVFEDLTDHINPPMSPSEPWIASICRHPMYPVAASQLRLRCPVCTIDLHINYVKVLTRKLEGANGRPLPRTGTPSEVQENAYLAWSQGKLSALRQLRELEQLSAKEAGWLEENPDFKHEEVQTAAKAIKLYWFETSNCPEPKLCDTKKQKKSVVFSEDTNFELGRPADYFLHRSPRYEPGKYTISDEMYSDDRDISEDSEDYPCMRVFALGGPVESDEHVHGSATKESVNTEDIMEEIEDDDGDSDWEDIDSDDNDEDDDMQSSEGSFISFEAEETNFIVFAND